MNGLRLPGLFKNPLFQALLFIGLGFVIYSNTFQVSFRFDDRILLQNPLVRDLRAMWIEGDLLRKIPYLSFALNYRWAGWNPWSWHLVNLILHILTALAVWGLARAAWKSPAAVQSPLHAIAPFLSVASGLIFLCHPIQTAAVTYVYQRTTLFAVLFHVLTLWLYTHGRVSGRKVFYALAAAAGGLALFTKQFNVSLPLTLLLCEVVLMRRFDAKRSWIRLAAGAAVFLGISAAVFTRLFRIDWARFSAEWVRQQYPTYAHAGLGWEQWIATELTVMRTYLRLLIWPANQTFDYDYPIARGLADWGVVGSAVLMAVIAAAGVWLIRRRHPMTGLGVLILLAVLMPEFAAIRDPIFEHRLYLPMAGFALAAPAGVAALLSGYKKAAAVIVSVVLVYGAMTAARNGVWADEEAFWKLNLRQAPANPRVYNALGLYYKSRGDHRQAAPLFEKATELDPDEPSYRTNVAYQRIMSGRPEEAVRLYREVWEKFPDNPEYAVNYAGALQITGRSWEAKAILERITRQHPFYSQGLANAGALYASEKNYSKAREFFERAVVSDPHLLTAWLNLAAVRMALGNFRDAEAAYRKVLDLSPGMPAAAQGLAAAQRAGEAGRSTDGL